MQNRVYLDHNATTPIHPELVERIPEWVSYWGNPSSIHWAGRASKQVLRQSRQAVAELIGASPLELIFTSGGSESNNFAIKGLALKPENLKIKKQILCGATEHPSVIKTVEALADLGFPIKKIPVDRRGQVDLEFYRQALQEPTLLVSFMFANNETGTIFPIADMARWAHEAGALFHCDGVQSLGKSDFDVKSLGVDMASFSGHKFYACKGVGALYLRKGVTLSNLIDGGGQERGRRAGTENTVSIASFGFMAKKKPEVGARIKKMAELRGLFEKEVLLRIDNVSVNAKETERVCNTSNLTIAGIDGESLLMNLDLKGFAISTGAACSSGNPEPSATLLAMGISRLEAQSTLRFSVGWFTTEEDVLNFVEALVSSVERLRRVEREMNEAGSEDQEVCNA